MLKGLVKGTFNPEDSHTVVMITPDGPTSYVFIKDMPLPQKIDGYFTPKGAEPKKNGLPTMTNSNLPISDDFNDSNDKLESPINANSDLR